MKKLGFSLFWGLVFLFFVMGMLRAQSTAAGRLAGSWACFCRSTTADHPRLERMPYRGVEIELLDLRRIQFWI